MSTKYKFREAEGIYFISYAVVYWIDLFICKEYKEALIDSWKYCMQNIGLEIYGWCIMTSHVHMLIGTKKEKLENIVRDMKRHTSEQLRSAIENHHGESRKEWMLWLMQRAGKSNSNNINFQLWQQNNHPILLSNPTMAWQKLDYIHNNPVAAGIVDNPEDYLYSSARDYLNKKGVFDIKLLDVSEKFV